MVGLGRSYIAMFWDFEVIFFEVRWMVRVICSYKDGFAEYVSIFRSFLESIVFGNFLLFLGRRFRFFIFDY